MQTGGNTVVSGQKKTTKRSDWHVIKFVADVMDYALWLLLNGVYKLMDLDIAFGNDNEIFSSLCVAVPYHVM